MEQARKRKFTYTDYLTWDDGKYINLGYFGDAHTLSVNILENCRIRLADIFPPVKTEKPRGPELPAE